MPQVYVLDDAKAARLKGRTMLVPTAQEIREAILAIPPGQTKTVNELRAELAESAGAEITCPRATTIGWFLVAEEDGLDGAAWWRLTREGKAEPRLPGGAAQHRALLLKDGVSV